jgi:hypothetical protein
MLSAASITYDIVLDSDSPLQVQESTFDSGVVTDESGNFLPTVTIDEQGNVVVNTAQPEQQRIPPMSLMELMQAVTDPDEEFTAYEPWIPDAEWLADNEEWLVDAGLLTVEDGQFIFEDTAFDIPYIPAMNPVESPQTEPPLTEPPQTEPPQTEPPQTEPPQTEPPQTELPQTEPPQTEPPQTELPQTEPPQTEPPQTEPPQTEPPQTEPPQTVPPEVTTTPPVTTTPEVITTPPATTTPPPATITTPPPTTTTPPITTPPKAEQTGFAIEEPGTLVFGNTPIQLSATGGEGTGIVTFERVSGDSLSVSSIGYIIIESIGTTIVRATRAECDNYLAATATLTLTVGARSISGVNITITSVHSYDGTEQTPIFTVTDGVSPNLITTGDYTVSFIGDRINVGTVTITLTGTGNYTGTASQTFNIDSRPLTVGFLAANKPYDGNTSAAVTGRTIASGLITGDDVTVSGGTAVFADMNTANDITVTASGFTLSGDDSGNYTIGTINSTTANITAKPITITPTSGQSKIRHEADPVLTFTHSPALIGSDSFTGALSRDLGEAVGNYAFALGDLSAGSNYTLSLGGTATFAITITAPDYTIPTGLTATYGDLLSSVALPQGWAWDFPLASVGGAGVRNHSATFTPADINNYSPVTRNVEITVAKANQTGFSINNPGTLTFGQTPIQLTTAGGQAGTVTWTVASGNAAHIAENTGYITIERAGTVRITATRAGDDNYNAVSVYIDLTIGKRDISNATIAEITDLVYTGLAQTPTPTVTDNTSPNNITTADFTVSHSNNTNAGAATVTITATADGNYTGTASRTFTIAPAPLTITANNRTITYGNEVPNNFSVTYGGFVGSDNEHNYNFTGALSVTSPYTQWGNAGNYAITPSGLTSSNYNITFQNGTLTVDPFNISAGINLTFPTAPFTYDGTAQEPVPTVTTVSGDIHVPAGMFTAAYSNNTIVGTATVNITGTGNFTGTASGNFTINRRPLTVGFLAADKPYDGNTSATVTGRTIASGLVSGDDVIVTGGTAVFAGINADNNITVTATGFTLSGDDSGNYTIETINTTTANITPRPLSLNVTGDIALSPIDTSTGITVNTGGLIGADEATVTLTPLAGLSFNSATDTLTYNGTQAFEIPLQTLSFTASAGTNYADATATLTIEIRDGQTVEIPRAIPVNQSNITAFNTYANTTAGLTRHYILTGDVNLNGITWTPIGNNTDRFTGTFEGSVLTISNLTLTGTTADNQGLFGGIGTGSRISNLNLVNVNITGSSRSVGGIAGASSGRIQNCFVSGSISGRSMVGGIAGTHNTGGIIQECYADITVSVDDVNNPSQRDRVGGIAGNNEGIIITCFVMGTVSSRVQAGGIAGVNENGGHIEDNVSLVNTVTIAESTSAGRVIGLMTGSPASTQANNFARFDVGGSTAQFNAKTHDGKDGANLTAANTWDSLGFSGIVFFQGKLPDLAPFRQPVGSGTAADPWRIYTVEDLLAMGRGNTHNGGTWGRTAANGNYRLMNNIDLAHLGQNNFTPIGGLTPVGAFNSAFRFTGSFDGQGFTINGLDMRHNALSGGIDYGMFVGFGSGARFENVIFTNANVIVTGASTGSVGGVVANSEGENIIIRNVHFQGNVESERGRTGGIVGTFNARGAGAVIVERCSFVGDIRSGSSAPTPGAGSGSTGGIIGFLGSVTGQAATVRIQDNFTAGSVRPHPGQPGEGFGGIIGHIDDSGNASVTKNAAITRNLSTMSVSAVSNVGGIVGQGNPRAGGTITISHNVALNPSISGTTDAGRVVGRIGTSTLDRNEALSSMTVNGTVPDISLGGHDTIHGQSESNFGNEAFIGIIWTNPIRLNWDFTTIWEWDAVNSRPKLRGQP